MNFMGHLIECVVCVHLQVAGSVTGAIFKNTTFTFSNVVGPQEEISLFGHPVTYIAPSVHGFPQVISIHYVQKLM